MKVYRLLLTVGGPKFEFPVSKQLISTSSLGKDHNDVSFVPILTSAEYLALVLY